MQGQLANSRIKKKKTDIGLVAHQKAPLDYISPWDGQTQPTQIAQSQHSDSFQKSRSQQKSHNIVNSFLDKIRKTQSIYRKNKLSKNYSLQDKQKQRQRQDILMMANNGKGFLGEHRDILKDTNRDSRVLRNGENGDKNIGEIKVVQDFGFGRVQYTKNIDRTITSIQDNQQTKKGGQISKSYTFYRKPQKTHTELQSFSESPEHSVLLASKSPYKDNTNTQFQSRSQIRSTYHQNPKNSKIFTHEELKNPKQLVFIKKKKNTKNITVVDINSTAQQFYEQQIRFAQQKMLTKYRRLKTREANNHREVKNYSRNRRCETQGGKKSAWGTRRAVEGKGEYSDRRVQEGYSFAKGGEIKKKYCFLEELKDQSIAVRIQNIMRCHPSLANTLLISK